ncbi:MAG: 7-carboxy-7-deazaguanine synthase QueE [Bacteroidales bacterium]|nr:7-carboxy-7-deazaguanine synthase QueE [Bacteroidales bacterium]
MKNHDKFLNTDFISGTHLPLIDEFYTLQGEGYYTGEAAYFIRVGGCDIGCRWCDEKISWSPALHKSVRVDEIIDKLSQVAGKTLVVTGGEPAIYNLQRLTDLAHAKGIKCHIETSGSYKITGDWDWICVSPKPQSMPLLENFIKASELKVIIYNDEDIEWAEACSEKASDACRLYLQPEWSRHAVNTPKIVDYIKNHPKWRISIQSHKFMKIP